MLVFFGDVAWPFWRGVASDLEGEGGPCANVALFGVVRVVELVVAEGVRIDEVGLSGLGRIKLWRRLIPVGSAGRGSCCVVF